MSFDRFGSYEGLPTIGRINPITDKDQLIPSNLWDPHYTDRLFTEGTTEGLTIFVDPEVKLIPGGLLDQKGEGLSYNYSDRISQGLGSDNVRKAAKRAAEVVGNAQSARYVEAMLRFAFEDDSLWVGHIRAGVNFSSGYPYKVYGFRSDK